MSDKAIITDYITGATRPNNALDQQQNTVIRSKSRPSSPMQDSQFRAAVERLSKNLSSDAPLRSDVPRGFYLNIRI